MAQMNLHTAYDAIGASSPAPTFAPMGGFGSGLGAIAGAIGAQPPAAAPMGGFGSTLGNAIGAIGGPIPSVTPPMGGFGNGVLSQMGSSLMGQPAPTGMGSVVGKMLRRRVV